MGVFVCCLFVVCFNGNVMTHIVPNASKASLLPLVEEHVGEGSIISTDDWSSYKYLKHMGYEHGIVKHQLNQWVKGVHHTQTIEGF